MALIQFEDLPSTNTPLNAANLNNNFNECYKADSGWQSITYEHTYSSYSANDYNVLQYRKIGNQVFLRGMIKSTATNPIGANATAGTLPATARPVKGVYFLANNADASISINIDTNGSIKVFNTSTSWVSLDGINFFVD